ncbi:Ig-like domain-containing protein [Klebsiella sp. BIGb0407]|uniref:Ig-like domain-containing protein n=1 Tax=Klebsiella sp. BIGb0407 TaxID=2940603 RepID=UPI0021684F70|nr:Ig-like domain-containing protein [Klebsiella sp. BIGb0407]MCS3432538.1 hypothetical protein [Klebsiella sp. BIGb0407]
MSLQSPFLPQVQDGAVQQAEVENGLIVQIPRYDNTKTDDMVFIMLNNSPVGIVSVTDISEFPLEYTINRKFTINNKNSVYYVIHDELSPSAEFTVIDFTISITATSGAAADGVSTNQVEVSIDTNGNPGSGNSILLTIVGSSALKKKPAIFDNESPIFSNGKNTILVTTDESDKATADFSSLIPGNVIIVATFQQKMVGTISSFVSTNAIDYPKLLGTHDVLCKGYVPITDFLLNTYLTVGHEYKLILSSPIQNNLACTNLYSFNPLGYCDSDLINNFEFYGKGLEHFSVLTSGSAAKFSAYRYGSFNPGVEINITVEIWDYGDKKS